MEVSSPRISQYYIRPLSFDWSDPQCLKSKDPYGATKYLQDLLSLSLNDQYGSKIKSIVGCPGMRFYYLGFYVTSQTHFVFRLLEPFLLLMRYI